MELRRLILSLGWVVFSIHFARPYSNSLGVNASSSAIKNSATYKNLPYSSEYSRSKLDLWAPNSRELSPLVVFFHSGGLTHGSRDSIPFKEIFLNLSSRGIAFASIGYPILGDLGEKYSAEEDSRNFIRNHTLKAINFLKSNSVKFKLDPTRLVLAGSSSGCILSLIHI